MENLKTMVVTNEEILKGNQIVFSDEFKYNGEIIKYEITNENTLGLYVEDCALSLGIYKSKFKKDGTPYKVIRYDEVYADLVALEKVQDLGLYKNLSNEEKSNIRTHLKQMTISEKDLYLWSFRVNTEQGKVFREWLATTVLPCLREHGIYITGMENMNPEQIQRAVNERTERYILRKWGIGIRRELTDTIKEVLNPPTGVQGGYVYAKFTNLVYNVLFDMDCKEYKEELGLCEKDNLRDCLPDKEINLISKAEDFLENLLNSGIKDYETLFNLLTNWHSNIKKRSN